MGCIVCSTISLENQILSLPCISFNPLHCHFHPHGKTWPCSATLAAGNINKFGIDCLPHCRAAGNWVLRHRLAAHSQYPSVGRCYHFAKSIRPYIAKILFQLSAILQVYDFVSRQYTRQHRETLFADITFKGLQYVFHTFIRKTTHENW